MSNHVNQENDVAQEPEKPQYFYCDDFKITMPVSECEKRRRVIVARILGSIDTPQGLTHQFMTKKCLECTAYAERTKPENLISHEQMMNRIQEIPSQKPGSTHTGNTVFYSISTPHVTKRASYYSALGK